ncbi:hypothetical protein [Pseudooceanicola sp.]|uniref:hypothetical protein n=1 Tax=Pseudooceanicola sp. TaxID=1914328 RepID=UPI0040589BE8
MALKLITRAVSVGAALMALAACLEAPQGGGENLFAVVSTVSRPVGDPLPQAPIAGGDLLIRGPEGYCVEGRSLRNQASGGFALLASCHVMTGGKQNVPVSPVVMTVSASRAEPGQAVPDRAALARAFAPAQVLTGSTVRGISMVQLASGGEAAVPDADPKHWRGAMELNGYLVLLAVYGPEGSYAADKGGGAMIVELGQALRGARPARPATADGRTERTATAPTAGRGLLGGLFQ